MRNIIVEPDSFWRRLFPFLKKVRQWCWKCHDRIAMRFVVSGGRVPFLDATLTFPPGVALTYATPLFWNGQDAYEGPTSRTLATLIGGCRVFLDVGSNVGIYAVYAGVQHPDVLTYAFEPVPVIWEKNRVFHRANGLDDSRVLSMAVGERIGAGQLILPIYSTGVEEEQTATLEADSWQANEARVTRIEIQCITLDHFAATQALPEGRCCVKIDVENHEAAVFRGGKEFFRTRRPWILCEVLPGQKFDAAGGRSNNNGEVVALVQELGYAIFAVTDDGCFRMNAGDFGPARGMKDFLFLPVEEIPADLSFVTDALLAEWLRAPPAAR